ncbi:c-type cytochrome [Mesorhizobium sp. AR10]|uniref:c-type cytochrome n=1 Tax=Mesorhizobium sp. AR10 TaxID=2865839 RepID=UPI0021606D81|nr:cytochrome c [Mesorhizobium sp. AR10]
MNSPSARRLGNIVSASFILALGATAALADSTGVVFSDGNKFLEQTGEAIYASVCQACHMEQGQGAVGAGKYPALAKNEKLEAAGYPVYLVIHGQKAMPPLGGMLDDEQIAAVVDYIRTHFGNNYTDPVTTDDVKSSR